MTLPPDVYSPEVLGIVMLELRNYIADNQQAATKAKVTGQTAVPITPHFSAPLRGVLAAAGVDQADVGALDTVVNELEKTRRSAPVAHLLMTALPNQAQKRQLVSWFRTNVHKDALLTFVVRTDLGGGVVVQAGSHVYDFSFKQQLLSNKKRISELMANVR